MIVGHSVARIVGHRKRVGFQTGSVVCSRFDQSSQPITDAVAMTSPDGERGAFWNDGISHEAVFTMACESLTGTAFQNQLRVTVTRPTSQPTPDRGLS